MSFGTFKQDPADDAFSHWIRLRDGKCVRCYSPVGIGARALPNTHTNSHYFGRRMEAVRFDPENCDTLCAGCHTYWEKEDREAYRAFKIRQLGQRGYDKLQIRAHSYMKKDRKLALIYWRARLKEDFGVPR